MTKNTAHAAAGGERPEAGGARADAAGHAADSAARPGAGGDRASAAGHAADSAARPEHADGHLRPDQATPHDPAAPRRPDGRDEKAVGRFVEDLASALMEMGFPRMPARVFAALLTTDSGRLTATELATTLQISPAAVSGAVRYLMQIAMVRRESEPGSRRHYYRAPDNVWGDVLGIRDHLMARWTGVLREGVEVLGADTPAGERVAESVRFFEFVSSELPSVVRKWRERRPADAGQAARDR